MQFKILFKKNFIYWKRNYKSSIAEILTPLLLAILLIFLRRLTTVTTATENSAPPIPLPTSLNDINLVPTEILKKTMKNCSARNGGSIGLAPAFDLTQQLATYFRKLNYTTIFFSDNREVDAWVLDDGYLDRLPDGSRKQLCLAVVFDKIDPLNYEYSLRYNLTGNPATVDHFSTDAKSFRKEFKIEDLEEYARLLGNGILSLQGLIDGLIFEKELNAKMRIKVQKMRNPEYILADYSSALESPYIITLIAAGLISLLRFISHIVSERERRNIENMENMGLSKLKYILSIYCFNLIIQFLIAIVFTIIIKIGVFKEVNVIVIFLTYFMFVFSLMTIGSIISAFFVTAKKAIITGLIVFFILFLFWILRDTISPTNSSGTTALALSPIGGLSLLTKTFIVFENSSSPYNFSELRNEVSSFKGQTYFIILFVEIVLFFWLGIYLFYVVPLKIGIAKHPLFIFGYPRKSKSVEPYSEFEDEELKNLNSEFPRENFEEVGEELKQQSRTGQTISINNLTKTFPNKKVAVSNLSLEIYRDQIFALLGHNGAGKTTTISMISGFLQKTRGDIKIMGKDSTNDREAVKRLMGVCPQTNPIFSYLTVGEHLELYARIKGVAGNLEADIDEILGDIDLLHKKNYLAGNLSGGQKRKLCVAIALVGKSRVILLDEPTSGMDTYARRHLWEVLKKYKKDRVIILTTHNMDEADYLGDRIGIMSAGKLVTCGAPLFLKKRFGDGYELVVLKRADCSEENVRRVKEMVLGCVKESALVSEIGSEIKFRLPEHSENFHLLFKELETRPDEFGVQSFGITLATLEDVFIKVAHIEIGDKNLKKDFDESLKIREDGSQKIFLSPEDRLLKFQKIEEEIQDKDLQALRIANSHTVFRMQMKALIKKRFIFFSRDISGIVCEIFLPILIVIAGLALTKISFVNDLPPLTISPSLYPRENSFLINELTAGGANITESLLNYFAVPPFSPSVVQTQNSTNFDLLVYSKSSDSQLYAYYLDSVALPLISYTLFFNTTAPFSPYLALNAMNNAVLKLISRNPEASIKMKLNPFLPTSGIKSIEDTIDGFIIVMLIALAFSFIPSSAILFIIKERENNAKHQQIISGANVLAYWLSNFLVDFAKYLVPALAAFILFFIFDVKFFVVEERAGMSFLLLFLYGFAMVGYTYVASFLFRKPSSGQIFIFLFCFFTSFVLVIIMFSLKLIVETRDVTQNVLDFIFRLIPSFSFPYGFLMMANTSIFALIFKWPKDTSVFSPKISLYDIIYIPSMAILTFILIFIIEFWFVLASKFKKSAVSPAIIRQISEKENEKEVDIDVKEEEHGVLNNLKDFTVKVSNLWKIYYLKSSANRQGQNINYKAAVKGITFGVERGMVFSLLGTNGAGKTSTFKILTGDTSSSFGEASIMGFQMPANLTQIRHLVGYCPQFDSVLGNLTAQEHLELFANLKGIDPKYHEALIERMLATMNLTPYRNVKAGEYSGGNKRKLNVAIALLGRPPIVVLDEPSSGMDPEARRLMWRVINEISTRRRHSSVILTTHSMEEAEALSTKIAIMAEGRIKTVGSVQQLKDKFGKGFELDVKVVIPSEEELVAEKARIIRQVQVKNFEELSSSEIRQIFRIEGLFELEKEIAPLKKGSVIFKRLELNKFVEGALFVEWIIISKKLEKVERVIRERFNAIVLETFQSYIRFKVPEANKLSDVFEFMNGSKEELCIASYSVRQISLEQIFIQFAQEIQHDD